LEGMEMNYNVELGNSSQIVNNPTNNIHHNLNIVTYQWWNV